MTKTRVVLSPFAALILLINSISAAGIALLCIDGFQPLLALVVGAIVFVLALLGLRAQVAWRRRDFGLPLALLLLVGLLVRYETYPYFSGAQDQGLYTNFSEKLAQGEGLLFKEKFRDTLTYEEKSYFDGAINPGTSQVSSDRYSIDFYPLHPIWMSISRSVFGEGRNTWSLLLFAAVGVLSLYYLTALVFRNIRAAQYVALLLSIHPALAFFSKFPVAEIPALAFSSSSFLFFISALRQHNPREANARLLIAVMSMASFCFVKMQFLFYLPFFAILILASLFVSSSLTARRCLVYAISCCVSFGISLAFYRFYQPALFYGVFQGHISTVVREVMVSPGMVVGVVVPAVALLGFGGYYVRRWSVGIVARRGGLTGRWCSWLILLGFLASIPSAYHLFATGEMAPYIFHSEKWSFASLRFHSLFRLIQLLGPGFFLVLLLLPKITRKLPIEANVLLVFLTCSWLVSLLQPWIPYLYYYGRYLVVDLLPFSVVLCCGAIVAKHGVSGLARKITMWTTVAYFALFSAFQFGKIETEDGKALSELKQYVKSDDVLVTVGLDKWLQAQIQLKEGFNVLEIGGKGGVFDGFGVLRNLVERTIESGNDVYLMSQSRQPLPGRHYKGSIESRLFYLSNGEHGLDGVEPEQRNPNPYGWAIGRYLLPYAQRSFALEYHLYKLDLEGVDILLRKSPVALVRFNELEFPTQLSRFGFSNPESLGTWTESDHAGIRFEIGTDTPYKTFTLIGHAYAPSSHEQPVSIVVNGSVAFEKVYRDGDNDIAVQLPIPVDASGELFVEFRFSNLASPLKLGRSTDARRLGIFLREIRFE